MSGYEILHISTEDEEHRCSGCNEVVMLDEINESMARNYDEPRCHQCMAKDEIAAEKAIERYLQTA